MNITIPRDHLIGALKHILQAADSRGTLPILTHVLINRTGDKLTLTGSDIGMEATSHVLLTDDGGKDGAICAPARKLYDIVRLLPEGAVVALTMPGTMLQVTSARSKFRLSTLPAESFPAFDETDVLSRITIDAATLSRAIDTVTGAMALNDVRFYLNGMLLHADTDGLITTGSDGHRLHRYRAAPITIEGDPGTSAIVPRAAALEMAKMLRSASDDAILTTGYRSVSLTVGADTLASKTVEGSYPDVSHAMPKDVVLTFKCARQALIQSLQRVATLTNNYRAARLSFETGQIILASSNAEQEEAYDAIEATIDSEPRTCGICVDYLITALGHVIADELEIAVSGIGAFLITDPADDGYSAVVMPVRL